MPDEKPKDDEEEKHHQVRTAPAYGGPPAWLRAQWKEKQIDFSVSLLSPGADRVRVIKLLRELRGFTLDEAKKKADTAPAVIAEAIPKAEAEEIQKRLQEVGATVSVF